MTAVDLSNDLVSRFLKDVGDINRAYFKQDGQIAEAFALTGGSYNAAVARGLYWVWQDALNAPADMTGMDPKDRQGLIDRRESAYKAWLKMPAPADAPASGPGHKRTVTPPTMFALARSSRRRG